MRPSYALRFPWLAIVAVWVTVLSSVASLTAADELAASYYQGDGLGVNWTLKLLEDGTYRFEWQGCLGLYAEEAGRWTVNGRALRLAVERRSGDASLKSLPATLIPIRWGKRQYLVPSGEEQDFCNLINAGTEPRNEAHGLAFLRQEDWKTPPSGKPDLPSDAAKYILAAPVRGRIARALTKRTANVDRGSAHGLQPGMRLYSQGYAFMEYRVLSTDERSCVVETLYAGDGVAPGAVSSLLYDSTLRPKCEEK